jgi:hypothetical protein
VNYGFCPDAWFAVCENTERDCLERRQWLVDNDMVWLLKVLKDRVKDLNDEEVWKYLEDLHVKIEKGRVLTGLFFKENSNVKHVWG